MIYQAETGNFTIALAGDTMLTRKLTPFTEPRFLALREILRSADAAFANLEGTVHDWDEGTPGITQGTFMTTDPNLLEDLKWLGINLICCANNHAFDYGEGGVLANIKHLDSASLAHAGTGKNLAEARAPAYLDTPNGRVALVATTATFRPWNQAGEQRPDLRGRPGINPLGFQTTHRVDPAAFEQLKRISRELGFEKSHERARKHFYSDKEIPDAKSAELSLLGSRFVGSEGFSIATQVNERDLQDNLRWIREARRQADWVVVSVHCHEFGGAKFAHSRDPCRTRRARGFHRRIRPSRHRRRRRHRRRSRPPFSLGHRNLQRAADLLQRRQFGLSKTKPSASSRPTPTSVSIWISKQRRPTSSTPAPTAAKKAIPPSPLTGKTCSPSASLAETSSAKLKFIRSTKASAVRAHNAADPCSPKAKWQIG